MTAASDALYQYRQSITPQMERHLFPHIPIKISDEIRPAYRGGYVYLNPKYKGATVGEGRIYDVNSMYPWVMYTKPMPYGEFMRFSGKYEYNERYPLSISTFVASFKLKQDHIPTIQLKSGGSYGTTEYVVNSNGFETLTLTNIDMDLLFKHYAVDVAQYIGGYCFKSGTGFFNEYIDKWMEVKQNESGAKRELAKLMLNSLYGKYGSNPHKKNSVPKWDEVKNRVSYSTIEKSEGEDSVYLPVGIFITSYARQHIITEAQRNYDNFIYCDTDSLHLLGTNHDISNIHSTNLGAYDLENEFTCAKYMRPKRYMFEANGRWKIKCAGLPSDARESLTIENFEEGTKIDNKLRARKVAGGTELYYTKFTLR